MLLRHPCPRSLEFFNEKSWMWRRKVNLPSAFLASSVFPFAPAKCLSPGWLDSAVLLQSRSSVQGGRRDFRCSHMMRGGHVYLMTTLPPAPSRGLTLDVPHAAVSVLPPAGHSRSLRIHCAALGDPPQATVSSPASHDMRGSGKQGQDLGESQECIRLRDLKR